MSAEPAADLLAIDTSNFRKHTHANPIQRRLIDRFHHRLAARIAELQPSTFLDAGCGEGFVAAMLQRQLPGLHITGFDFNPSVGRRCAAAWFPAQRS
ncbi:MAG: hypothetical protein KatS3mg059_1694 [Thermomicrobiales bacterium]|nr:MAG: hypothetical protein KatS3mg059_1694 [Thermomicrobiales bacterium]